MLFHSEKYRISIGKNSYFIRKKLVFHSEKIGISFEKNWYFIRKKICILSEKNLYFIRKKIVIHSKKMRISFGKSLYLTRKKFSKSWHFISLSKNKNFFFSGNKNFDTRNASSIWNMIARAMDDISVPAITPATLALNDSSISGF